MDPNDVSMITQCCGARPTECSTDNTGTTALCSACKDHCGLEPDFEGKEGEMFLLPEFKDGYYKVVGGYWELTWDATLPKLK